MTHADIRGTQVGAQNKEQGFRRCFADGPQVKFCPCPQATMQRPKNNRLTDISVKWLALVVW